MSISDRNIVATKMTLTQVAEAQNSAREWDHPHPHQEARTLKKHLPKDALAENRIPG